MPNDGSQAKLRGKEKPVDRSVVKLVLGSQGLQRGVLMASVVTGVALPATTEITPARVFFANPNTYRSIVALSTEGMGAMRIGKILHVSPMVLGGAGPQA